MKRALNYLLVIMVFSIFGTKAQATQEQDFWAWFSQNEPALFDFEKDQDKVFGQLSGQMRKIDPNLTFEFGPKSNGKREFVISADGMRDSFPAVISLYNAAPKLNRWIFIKFRPRREPMGIAYAGVKVEVKDVSFTLEPDGEKVAITIYIAGYDPAKETAYGSIGFLMLDQALGEYDMETKVGPVGFKPADFPTPLMKKPLSELPGVFDSYFSGH